METSKDETIDLKKTIYEQSKLLKPNEKDARGNYPHIPCKSWLEITGADAPANLGAQAVRAGKNAKAVLRNRGLLDERKMVNYPKKFHYLWIFGSICLLYAIVVSIIYIANVPINNPYNEVIFCCGNFYGQSETVFFDPDSNYTNQNNSYVDECIHSMQFEPNLWGRDANGICVLYTDESHKEIQVNNICNIKNEEIYLCESEPYWNKYHGYETFGVNISEYCNEDAIKKQTFYGTTVPRTFIAYYVFLAVGLIIFLVLFVIEIKTINLAKKFETWNTKDNPEHPYFNLYSNLALVPYILAVVFLGLAMFGNCCLSSDFVACDDHTQECDAVAECLGKGVLRQSPRPPEDEHNLFFVEIVNDDFQTKYDRLSTLTDLYLLSVFVVWFIRNICKCFYQNGRVWRQDGCCICNY